MVNYTLNPHSNTLGPDTLQHACLSVCIMAQQNSTLGPDTLRHARLSVCIMAQQNSFAKFILLRLYSRNYKLGADFRVVSFFTFYFLNLLNFEIAKLEIS
jgi:hypothetical protein